MAVHAALAVILTLATPSTYPSPSSARLTTHAQSKSRRSLYKGPVERLNICNCGNVFAISDSSSARAVVGNRFDAMRFLARASVDAYVAESERYGSNKYPDQKMTESDYFCSRQVHCQRRAPKLYFEASWGPLV